MISLGMNVRAVKSIKAKWVYSCLGMEGEEMGKWV